MSLSQLKDYTDISLYESSLDGYIDFDGIFPECSPNLPVHIEIGSGKGTFLVAQAGAEPDTRFLGIEWANKYYRYAVDRIGRRGLKNVRIIRTDVAVFIPEHIADNCVDCYHIYFPDPWPKKRHHKRRFINTKNFAELIRTLKAGGRVQIATDHSDYRGQIEEVLNERIKQGGIKRCEFVNPASAQPGETVGTNYERKYLKEGREIYTFSVRVK